MDVIAVGAVVLLIGLILIMPIVALLIARSARREVDRLRAELVDVRWALDILATERSQRAGVVPPTPAPAGSATPDHDRAAADGAVDMRKPTATATPIPPPAAAEIAPHAAPEVSPHAAPEVSPHAAPEIAPHAAPVAASAAHLGSEANPASAPRSSPKSPDAAAESAPPSASLEEKIALVWFTRIGAAALLLGVAWFFKYAVDNDWVGPLGRVALGAVAGAVTLAGAELLRPRTRSAYIQVLTGVGLAFLFLSAYAAHAFYHLIPASPAFAAFAVIALLGGALAIHHRGEAILVLSLIAGLAAPVLLSTGEDRPAALFSYLFVLTSLAFWTALRMSFRWATWLAIVGPMLLFAGWYQRFFDVHPAPAHPMVDEPAAQLAGAYFPLWRRAAPLLAVAAAFTQWVAVYVVARRRSLERLWPLAILAAAALAAHAGFAALLYDRAPALGLVLAALGLASSLLFGREGRRELLLLPLGAAFVVLLEVLHGGAGRDVFGILALLSLWGAVYARAFLANQLGAGRTPSTWMLAAVGAVGLALAIASGILLLDYHPWLFAIGLTTLSLLYALLSVAAGRPLVAGVAALLSLGGFCLVENQSPHRSPLLILILAAWASVYLLAVAWDLLKRRAPATALRLATFSVAGLGFTLLSLWQTSPSNGLLRAGLLAAVGLVDLGLGAALVERERPRANVLLGQALALFAGAFAFLFSGATLTLVWAAMAAVVAILAATEEDESWLAGALALFIVAVTHLLTHDLELAHQQEELFFASAGHAGALGQTPFLNPTSYALVGCAVALGVAARALVQRTRSLFRRCAGTLVIVAHALLLTWLVIELHQALMPLPKPVAGLDGAELDALYTARQQAIIAAEQSLRMATTLIFGVYAALLVAAGFFARERLHRYLGLALFALTLAKLALYDVWQLPRVYQMIILLAVGALLLGASFLYARFGRRLAALIRDGAGDAGKAALVLVALGAAGRAHAFDSTKLEFERPINGVSAPGLYHAEIDPELYRKARSERFDDLRIAGPDGQEIPWLVRPLPAAARAVTHAVTIVDPVRLDDGSVQATLDLGAPGLKHSEVQLSIAGDGDWFRRARVESSTDEQKWALLAEGAYVFRVTASGSVSEQTRLVYPTSDARYLRVTLAPAAGPEVRITAAHAAWVPPESHVPLRLLPTLQPSPVPQPGDAHASDYFLDLGAPGVPVAELALDLAEPAFERRALLAAANHQAYWAPVGSTLLYRIVAAGNQPAQENARIPAGGARKRYFRLTIWRGDDSPLTLRAVSPGYVAEELIFRAPAAGAYTIYVGGELPAPTYDLAAVLARSGEEPTQTAAFASVSANPSFGQLNHPAPPPALTERYQRPIAIGLGLILAGLAAWTVQLLRRPRPPQA